MSTSYTNTLQVNSEWAVPIYAVWIIHNDSVSGGMPFSLGSVNLVKDGPDLPTPGWTLTTYSGHPDTWAVAFLDVNNNLFCTDFLFTANVPNKSGPNDIELTLSGAPVGGALNQVTFVWQDGSSGGSFPLSWRGTGTPGTPQSAATGASTPAATLPRPKE